MEIREIGFEYQNSLQSIRIKYLQMYIDLMTQAWIADANFSKRWDRLKWNGFLLNDYIIVLLDSV